MCPLMNLSVLSPQYISVFSPSTRYAIETCQRVIALIIIICVFFHPLSALLYIIASCLISESLYWHGVASHSFFLDL